MNPFACNNDGLLDLNITEKDFGRLEFIKYMDEAKKLKGA
jgi:hypothetical protein